jgi:hypothetical protein
MYSMILATLISITLILGATLWLGRAVSAFESFVIIFFVYGVTFILTRSRRPKVK